MKYRLLAATALCATMLAAPAFAQETEADGTGQSEDIVVTATRGESLLSKTPIAMTAISGGELVESGITNPTQLTDAVPNLSIVRVNGLQITIRGVTSTDNTEKGDPSAAFLLDGIYIARPQTQEISFYDIERVEVLRGPQGTLYGRNTTAGVINVISALPKHEFQASADISYESYDHLNTSGMLNVPLGESFAIRAAVNYDRRDSYIVDGANDGFTLDPFRDVLSARLSALFEPTDTIRLVLRGDYNWVKGYPRTGVPVSNFFADSNTPPFSVPETTPTYLDPDPDTALINPWTQAWQGYRDARDRGVMAEFSWGLTDDLALTYLGSYRENDLHDSDTFSFLGNRTTFDGDYRQTSHEVRLAYDSGPLQLQGGGYYFKERSRVALFLLDPQNIGFPPFVTGFGFPQDPAITIGQALFAQATYALTPELKVTAGVRYSHDDKSRVGATVLDTDPAARPPGTPDRINLTANDAERVFSKATWRLGLDYDVPGLGLLYASVATGYKAGGFNDGCEAAPGAPALCTSTFDALYYEPETLTAYEAGFKFRFGSAFRLNASLFHYDYQGLQLSAVRNVCGGANCQVTDNAGRAKVDGVELEAVVRPAANHQFNLSANYLDARYTSFEPVPGVSYAGRPLARSPEFTWTAGYTLTVPLGNGGSIAGTAKTRFSDRYDLTDVTSRVHFFQPSYTKTDISFTYNGPDERYYVGVFGKNLENEIVITSVDNTFGVRFEDPRTFGVRAGVRF